MTDKIYTMDDPEYWNTPHISDKTLEERAEELDRLYPRGRDKASYLRYRCHYCTEEFFLMSPYRSKGMNSYNEGFMDLGS